MSLACPCSPLWVIQSAGWPMHHNWVHTSTGGSPKPSSEPLWDPGQLGDGAIALVDGLLVMSGAIDPALVKAWTDEPRHTTAVAVIDTAAVTFFGGAGLQLVIRLARTVSPQRLVPRDPARLVLRLLDVTGLTDLVDVEWSSLPRT